MSRDYPSMSYCAFENTGNHLEQVMNMLDEALQENEPLDLNDYEKRAYNRMYDQCRTLMALLEDHQNLIDDHDGCDEKDDSDEESMD